MCMPVLAVTLFSGCALPGRAQQSCKIFDPDLAPGVYSGSCKDGFADGYGEVSGAGSYRGDFRTGKKHGKGIKVMPNGDRYAGDFSDDYRHGQRVYVWGDKTRSAGARYQGNTGATCVTGGVCSSGAAGIVMKGHGRMICAWDGV